MATTVVGTLSNCNCDVCPECGDCDGDCDVKCIEDWRISYDCESQEFGDPLLFTHLCYGEGDELPTLDTWTKLEDSEGVCQYQLYKDSGQCCDGMTPCMGEGEAPESMPDTEDCDCPTTPPPECCTAGDCCFSEESIARVTFTVAVGTCTGGGGCEGDTVSDVIDVPWNSCGAWVSEDLDNRVLLDPPHVGVQVVSGGCRFTFQMAYESCNGSSTPDGTGVGVSKVPGISPCDGELISATVEILNNECSFNGEGECVANPLP